MVLFWERISTAKGGALAAEEFHPPPKKICWTGGCVIHEGRTSVWRPKHDDTRKWGADQEGAGKNMLTGGEEQK